MGEIINMYGMYLCMCEVCEECMCIYIYLYYVCIYVVCLYMLCICMVFDV